MLNNAYQNLELKIDLLSGGTITGLKEKIKYILGNKLLIICGLKIDGKPKLPIVCQPNIYITQTEEPDDWNEEEDGEFISEDVYHLEVKNIYGYDLTIENDIVSSSKMSLSVGSLSVDTLTSGEDEITTKKPVVEEMPGYSFVAYPSTANWNYEYIYAGIVKNGNKLTFCIALNLSCLSASAPLEMNIGSFSCPVNILSRLYPSLIGGVQLLDNRFIAIIPSTSYATLWQGSGYAQKREPGITANIIIPSEARSEGQTIYVRYEATFLLSDNLAE